MTHKADKNFFAHKREWSKRKDEIIGCYLSAYLPKIMTLQKPIVIVDGFAGPGQFDDGEAGSPLIICDCISQTFAKNLRDRQEVKLICVETIPALFDRLEANLAPFAFASAKPGKFSDYSGDISRLAESRSVFLYVDPFTVEGLIWADLEQIYRGLEFGNSVEILLNLNSVSFIRRGLAALKLQLDEMDDENEVPVDIEISETPLLEKLDAVAGGKWWQQLIAERMPFPETVHEFTVRYCRRLSSYFKEVVFHPIKAEPHHRVPKYYLVFGTRHIDGLTLMNDEMVKSRRTLADMALPKEPTLFELRSEELVPDVDRLPDLVLEFACVPTKRRNLIGKVIQGNFCDFHRSEIRGCIESLLKTGQLVSETGKTSINDNTKIWAATK